VIHQLRVYEIFEETKTAFHARFRDHAMRIMARHGFDFVACWEARMDGRTEFVYLLRWPDEARMRAQWDAFMADEEWARIKVETRPARGSLVGAISERVLFPAGYGPRPI